MGSITTKGGQERGEGVRGGDSEEGEGGEKGCVC